MSLFLIRYASCENSTLFPTATDELGGAEDMSALIKGFNKVCGYAALMPKTLAQKLCLGLKNIRAKARGVSLILSVSMFCISACSATPKMVSAPITGYNHTSAEIISFSINGAGGPRIPPNQSGGEVCCGVLPVEWDSGVRAVIEWDKDSKPYESLKRDQYGQIVKEAAVRHSVGYSHHTATVEIPKYAKELCALQVHFLPCDQVKVSTTCFTPENPNYPDKAYFQVKESASCSNH